jgi:hypothetical protein
MFPKFAIGYSWSTGKTATSFQLKHSNYWYHLCHHMPHALHIKHYIVFVLIFFCFFHHSISTRWHRHMNQKNIPLPPLCMTSVCCTKCFWMLLVLHKVTSSVYDCMFWLSVVRMKHSQKCVKTCQFSIAVDVGKLGSGQETSPTLTLFDTTDL